VYNHVQQKNNINIAIKCLETWISDVTEGEKFQCQSLCIRHFSTIHFFVIFQLLHTYFLEVTIHRIFGHFTTKVPMTKCYLMACSVRFLRRWSKFDINPLKCQNPYNSDETQWRHLSKTILMQITQYYQRNGSFLLADPLY
jgi:hypothetical protein